MFSTNSQNLNVYAPSVASLNVLGDLNSHVGQFW